MANVETIRDEYTFLVQAGATYEHIFYERRLGLQVYYYFVERSGRAVAHESRRGAKGIRTVGQKDCLRSKWIPGQLSDFVVSGTGRECSALWRSPARRPAPLPPVYLYLLRIIYSSGPESSDDNHACIHRSTVQPRSAGRDGALQRDFSNAQW